jgi:hypothetical protein
MTMWASNHHDDAFRKEVGTQDVDIAGHGHSWAKHSLYIEGGRPPPTEDNRAGEPSHLVATRQPGLPRPTIDHCQDPSTEKHHLDIACHRHPFPWRPAPPRTRHATIPTTGIATPNHMLSGLCHRPTPNVVIPTTRTTTLLCRGPHQSCHHCQTPP